MISREQALIRRSCGRFVLYNLSRTNPTFVNDTAVEEHILQDGDVIRVAENAFRFIED